MVEQTQEKFYQVRIEDCWLVVQMAPDKATIKTPLDSVQGVQIAMMSFEGEDFTIDPEAVKYINDHEYLYGFEIRDLEDIDEAETS